jgi:hypothetical protein
VVQTPTEWQTSSIGDRRSVFGAVAVAAVVAAFVFLVPFLEENVQQRGAFDDAGRFVVDDYTSIALAEGWQVDSMSEFFTILTDGDHTLVFPISNPADGSPEDALNVFYDAHAADPANVVTPIVTFATDAGAPAAGYRAVIASDPSGDGAAFYAVVDNGRSVEPSITGPADLDDPYYEAADAMVRSIVITATPREGQS